MWNQELSRIFDFVVEQESNALRNYKALPSESKHQSQSVPIPSEIIEEASDSTSSVSFLGRLADDIIRSGP